MRPSIEGDIKVSADQRAVNRGVGSDLSVADLERALDLPQRRSGVHAGGRVVAP